MNASHGMWRFLTMLAVVAGGLGHPAMAADRPEPKKYALLVGVNKYEHAVLNAGGPLKYAEADATEMAELLRGSGYEVDVLLGHHATRRAILDHVEKIKGKGNTDGVVLVGLAGHGVQFEKDDDAYYCPYDAKIREAVREDRSVVDSRGRTILEPTPESCVRLTDIVDRFKLAPAGTRILLADCCRNDPTTGRGRGVGSGIKMDRLPGNTAILLSCSEGQRSWEDDKWKHGVFFYHVLAGLRDGRDSVIDLQAYLEKAVPLDAKDLGHAPDQDPHPLINGRRLGFGLVRTSRIEPLPNVPPVPKARRGGEVVENSLGMKLVKIPAGEFLMGGEETADELRRAMTAARIEWSYDDDSAFEQERPVHRVRITKPFLMGQTEVTLGEFLLFYNDGYKGQLDCEKDDEGGSGYDAATGKLDAKATYRPWSWGHPDMDFSTEAAKRKSFRYPVVNVSWNDAVAFCEWLSKKEGKRYRLPTEAEWEYACRGGTKTRYWFGDDFEKLAEHENVGDQTAKDLFKDNWAYNINSRDGFAFTAPVRSYRQPNPFGLYDMHGNVAEWCSDWFDAEYYEKSPAVDPKGPSSAGSFRVIRGGSWDNRPVFCRSANRHYDPPSDRSNFVGFRLVCEFE